MSTKVGFRSASDCEFTKTLKSRIDAYFEENHLSRHMTPLMAAKIVFYLGGYLGIFAAILSGRFSEPVMLLMATVMGFFVSGIGFNISHDASHGGLSAHPWVNRLFAHTFTLIGANAYNWGVSHNVVHHTFTNIPEADGDLYPVPLMRFNPGMELRPIHRYQHLFAWSLYCLTSLMWVTKKDFRHFFQDKLIIYEKPKPPLFEYFILFGGKIAYYVAIFGLPMWLLSLPFWKVLIGFIAMHLVAGFMLATVFQLGHLVEGTAFPSVAGGRLQESFASHQCQTSANFACQSFLASWITGGLNCQIEHHLFPRVCHIHYPKLAPIVKKTAEEFGVQYIEYPSFAAALRSHYRTMKRLGQQPSLTPAHA